MFAAFNKVVWIFDEECIMDLDKFYFVELDYGGLFLSLTHTLESIWSQPIRRKIRTHKNLENFLRCRLYNVYQRFGHLYNFTMCISGIWKSLIRLNLVNQNLWHTHCTTMMSSNLYLDLPDLNLQSISSTFYAPIFCTKVCSKLNSKQIKDFRTKNAHIKCWWNWYLLSKFFSKIGSRKKII